jgi:3-oxoadipate enol-lactonase
VVLHGMLATSDHVLLGSTKLERAGFRVVRYDVRGHGRSTPPPTLDGYRYEFLLQDLLAVLDAFAVDGAVLLGVSIGAHTALRLALEHPERVEAIVAAMPAYDPRNHPDPAWFRHPDKVAEAVRARGVQGFVEAYELPPAWGKRDEAVRNVLGRRMTQHLHLDAVADAIEHTLRDRPFDSFDDLAAVRQPVIVVGARDEYEGDHSYELAAAYAAAMPNAELVSEPPGRPPLAWNGGALAGQVLEVAQRAGVSA